MSARLWLIRHGATDWSDAGRLNGWSEVALNKAGRTQARRLASALVPVEFTGVWSSDLGRSTETAHIAVGEAVTDPRLRELDFGDLEGSRWQDHTEDVRSALLRFDGFAGPGGESVTQLRDRVFDFITALPPGEHLTFTHGGVIRLLLRELGRDRAVAPGEIVRLTVTATPGSRAPGP